MTAGAFTLLTQADTKAQAYMKSSVSPNASRALGGILPCSTPPPHHPRGGTGTTTTETGHSLQVRAHVPQHRQGQKEGTGADRQPPSKVGATNMAPHSSHTQLCPQQPDPRLHSHMWPEERRGGRASFSRGTDSNKPVGTQESYAVMWIKQTGDMPSVAEGSRPHWSGLASGLILLA